MKFLLVKLFGLIFISSGLILASFIYYQSTEKVDYFEGVIVGEYDKWPNYVSMLLTPSSLVRYTPFLPGPYHIIFRRGNSELDLNYFSSGPTGKLSVLDKSQTYLAEYTSATKKISNLWSISKLTGKKVSYGPFSYSYILSKLAFGFLAVTLIVVGALFLIEKSAEQTPVKKKVK